MSWYWSAYEVPDDRVGQGRFKVNLLVPFRFGTDGGGFGTEGVWYTDLDAGDDVDTQANNGR